ncbi:MAG: hypothetical protein AAGB11_14040 [Pseudomonadota bacterium]
MSVSAVEDELAQRRWRVRIVFVVATLLVIVGLVVAVLGGTALLRLTGTGTPSFASEEEHFKYGSIGAEPNSGLPYAVWKALPALFPEAFEGRDDYSAFGFTYEVENGVQKDLPIGISRRTYQGVDLVWFNCAVCHASTVRTDAGSEPQTVLAMPSHGFDLGRFIDFVLGAAADPRLGPDVLLSKISEEQDLGLIDGLIWRFAVMPRLREELLARRDRLKALKDEQPPWGPGRVDTFNPYKTLEFNMRLADLDPSERLGASDFPSIFLQGPREGMQLHWDGNNASLAERNLSAALGAGVTPDTVDHAAVERVAAWLADLRPPPSPHRPPPDSVARGRALYMNACASCHGYQSEDGYVFEGERLGLVEDIADIGTDRARLDSYTAEFAELQKSEFFKGTPYQFKHFTKSNGYANAPLDGLWLRGPYLHNGAVPTLAALLAPPDERPNAFERGSNVVDRANGGFVSPPCDPATASDAFCFDTLLPGNGNGGHVYGTDLSATQKSDLLEYLKTF